MNKQRQQVYLNLIQELLSCSSREEINILWQQNQHLINENPVKVTISLC